MKNSSIEWTHHTFNGWIGCTKVSPGCKNCYAAAMDKRWGNDRWGVGKPRGRTAPANWRQPLLWNLESGRAGGERHRVFCASLSDIADAEVQPLWRLELLDLIRRTPNLDWLLLTKRPDLFMKGIATAMGSVRSLNDAFDETLIWLSEWIGGNPPRHVWGGTTVEDQARTVRIAQLRDVPLAVRFLSCEPLLERVNLHLPVNAEEAFDATNRQDRPGWCEHPRGVGLCRRCRPGAAPGIDWVICGGESGAGARPMDADWARSVRDQCAAARVPFLFKQWGTFNAEGRRGSKAANGRTLDGVVHNAFPTSRGAQPLLVEETP